MEMLFTEEQFSAIYAQAVGNNAAWANVVYDGIVHTNTVTGDVLAFVPLWMVDDVQEFLDSEVGPCKG